MKIKYLSLVSLIVLTCSCSGVNMEWMQRDIANYVLPVKPQKDMVLVYVVRPSNLGGLIKFNVFLDDKKLDSEMGYTLGNKYIYFFTTPGNHKIFSKAENWAETNITAEGGDQIFIKQNVRMGFIMARNSLGVISETEGKFYIKNSKNGGIKRIKKDISN